MDVAIAERPEGVKDQAIRIEVVGLGEHLDDRVMLELLDGLLDPVGADEGEIRVDPGDVASVARKSGHAEVDQIFLGPEFMSRADLDVARVIGPGDFEGALTEGHLDDCQPRAGFLDMSLEGAEEVVPAPVSDRIGDDGHDVEKRRGSA